MPRQDVPYGGVICRLKERIAELFDLVGEKLHSINGVKGDGQGNVKIVSGDPAVVITNDAAQNEIEIALDSSELPSAAVQSVNGETGAVVLDGNDIETFEGSGVNVTDAIVTNVGQLNNLQGRLNQETSDRQNGDAALQASINQVQAGIPGAAAAAVAADPTVAQLAADVPNKVDKITSGSTKRAYTHTGAVQDDTPVVNGTDANSIGLRDANGRLQAADPASGATDKTLVTANWISQTGDNGPNNLIHKTGNESKTGMLGLPYGMDGVFITHPINSNNSADNVWRLAFQMVMNNNETFIFDIFSAFNNGNTQDARIKVYKRENTVIGCFIIDSSGNTQSMASASNYVITQDNGIISFYTRKINRYCNLLMRTVFYGVYGNNRTLPQITYYNTDSTDPTTDTHESIAVGVRLPYHNEQ